MAADREAINLAQILNTDAEHIKIPLKAKAGQGDNKSFMSVANDANLNLNFKILFC